jgi:hypothetical protein
MLLIRINFLEEALLSPSPLPNLPSPSLSLSVVVVEDIPKRLLVAIVRRPQRRLPVVAIESLANK